MTDATFVLAVECSYADEARRRTNTGLTPLKAHRAALTAAISAADSENGGGRYRALDIATRDELEARLMRVWD